MIKRKKEEKRKETKMKERMLEEMKETGEKKERRSMTTKSKELIRCILRHKWDTMSAYLNSAYELLRV